MIQDDLIKENVADMNSLVSFFKNLLDELLEYNYEKKQNIFHVKKILIDECKKIKEDNEIDEFRVNVYAFCGNGHVYLRKGEENKTIAFSFRAIPPQSLSNDQYYEQNQNQNNNVNNKQQKTNSRNY